MNFVVGEEKNGLGCDRSIFELNFECLVQIRGSCGPCSIVFSGYELSRASLV